MSEREVITSEAKRAAVGEDDYESKRALKVAQATIMSLQVRNEEVRWKGNYSSCWEFELPVTKS